MPESFEEYWKVVRPVRRTGANAPPSKPPEVEAEPPTYAEVELDIEQRVQATLEEMRAQGIRVDMGYADRLRTTLLGEFEESTRSAPDPDPSPLNADQPFLNYQADAARMRYQVSENASWYLSQGIMVSLITLERAYRNNGGLRMDFTPERAEEERLQRESAQADLQAQIQARRSPSMRTRLVTDIEEVRSPSLPPQRGLISDPTLQAFFAGHDPQEIPEPSTPLRPDSGLQYEVEVRRSTTLLNIVNLFNELGVSCVVVSSQTGNRNVELQFSLFRDTPECPTSIGGYLSSDGVVHLNLGYRNNP